MQESVSQVTVSGDWCDDIGLANEKATGNVNWFTSQLSFPPYGARRVWNHKRVLSQRAADRASSGYRPFPFARRPNQQAIEAVHALCKPVCSDFAQQSLSLEFRSAGSLVLVLACHRSCTNNHYGSFRKAKKSGQTSPLGPASRALSDLVSLIGEWTGEAIDWDPDWEQSHRRPMGVGFELDEDGRHLVIHYWANHGGPVMRSFDVLGVDSSGEELLRTHFVGRNRQTHHFRILDHKKNGRGRDFSLSLETTAWDEARPCEIRWEIHRRGDALEMKTSRCLIGMSDDFVQTSTFTLSRI